MLGACFVVPVKDNRNVRGDHVGQIEMMKLNVTWESEGEIPWRRISRLCGREASCYQKLRVKGGGNGFGRRNHELSLSCLWERQLICS